MDVNVIYRSLDSGPSIRKVFESFVPHLEKSYNIRRIVVPDPGANPRAMLRNFMACLRAPKAAVNHVTGDIHYCVLAYRRRTTVLTIHDLNFLRLKRGFPRLVKYLLWVWLPVKYARRVVCISEATREHLQSIVKVCPDKISVIVNPVAAAFVYRAKEFNAVQPRILHIGTKTQKNLPRVVRALGGISCHLRIIGRPDSESLAALAGMEYSFAENITDQQIVEEYAACDLVSFPSLYEGFGMPIVEGQAMGRVVLTSSLEPMHSVAGGAAIEVDPYDVASIRAGFEKCIADAALREELIRMGLENARRYSPSGVAAQYHNIYDGL